MATRTAPAKNFGRSTIILFLCAQRPMQDCRLSIEMQAIRVRMRLSACSLPWGSLMRMTCVVMVAVRMVAFADNTGCGQTAADLLAEPLQYAVQSEEHTSELQSPYVISS